MVDLELDASGVSDSRVVVAQSTARNEMDARTVSVSGGEGSNCSCTGGTECTCAVCSGAAAGPQLVYAIGQIGIDFGSEARRDSLAQAMPEGYRDPGSFADLLVFFDVEPYEAESVIQTLNSDLTPIYAIQPSGGYATVGYERLREFLRDRVEHDVELVSIPGVVVGSARLLSGQVVPVIRPAIRGMSDWKEPDLVRQHLLAEAAGEPADQERRRFAERFQGNLSDFLNKVYYGEARNLGLRPEERALNYAATNAFQIAATIERATREGLELGPIDVKPSPICRPGSACYDVELVFFNPENIQRASRVFRFTVDVSDVVPVFVGELRSWTRR